MRTAHVSIDIKGHSGSKALTGIGKRKFETPRCVELHADLELINHQTTIDRKIRIGSHSYSHVNKKIYNQL